MPVALKMSPIGDTVYVNYVECAFKYVEYAKVQQKIKVLVTGYSLLFDVMKEGRKGRRGKEESIGKNRKIEENEGRKYLQGGKRKDLWPESLSNLQMHCLTKAKWGNPSAYL